MSDYYLLRSLSDHSIYVPNHEVERLRQGMDKRNFLIKDVALRGIHIQEKPSEFPLNFTEPILLGVVQRNFLSLLMGNESPVEYLQLAKIFLQSGENVDETEYLLYKAFNVIYIRATKKSLFKREEDSPIVYIPNGTPYITQVPSHEIPIYGTQIAGELIIREDLYKNIEGKKYKKLHVRKLKIQPPIDGFEFEDSLSFPISRVNG